MTKIKDQHIKVIYLLLQQENKVICCMDSDFVQLTGGNLGSLLYAELISYVKSL